MILTLTLTLTPDPSQVHQPREAPLNLTQLMPSPHVHHVSVPSLTWLGLALTLTLL